ncbi:MAG: 16S rRNA (guanine(527)-N(7))-methyltransferase RsmG [Bradymonadales bacterium]|jgi:16S rRNA (guanine(527)-N(7))-methyltransferase RsmG
MQEILRGVNKILRPWCEENLGAIEQRQVELFAAYLTLLKQYKQKVNIIGSRDVERILRDLVIDSLQILRAAELASPLVDVGSGAGFPGVPIKIMRPELALYMVEPNVKRYAFLRVVERTLGLQTLAIHNCPVEELPSIRVGSAISKAFRTLPEWLKLGKNWIDQGAQLACLFSKNDWDTLGIEWLAQNPQYALKACVENEGRVYLIIEKNA